MAEKIFNVDGMSCGHCTAAVKGAVEDLEGVIACEVNLEEGTAKVTFSEDMIESDIVEAIEDEGFTVS